jgi:hypothetical protein
VSTLALGSPIQLVPGTHSFRIIWVGREADPSLSSSSKVKKEWSYTPIYHYSRLSNNCTFYDDSACSTEKCPAKHNTNSVPQLPHSPDLVLCDFFLFIPTIKMVPKGMSLIMKSAQFEKNCMLHLLSSKQVVSTNTFTMAFTASLIAPSCSRTESKCSYQTPKQCEEII